MKALSIGIFTRLSALYGASNVFHGYAAGAAIPYVTFILNPAGAENTYARAVVEGTYSRIQVRITYWGRTFALAADAVEDILTDLKTNLTLTNDTLIQVNVMDREVTEEEAIEQNGQRVYRGYTLVECVVIHGG